MAQPTPTLKRKIAAILAADVAGYSRLVAENEERTLHELAAAREVFDAFVAQGGGRIFNTAGDSVMCEFDSAVEAVRAAVEIQASLAARSAGVARNDRLTFRIGITIGDVVERGTDLLGDGVNIAARLESLAEPGGICVSRSVHEAVANKVAVTFREIGPRQLKNIPNPVHVYSIAPPPVPTTARDAAAVARPRRVGLKALAAAGALAVAGVGAALVGGLDLRNSAGGDKRRAEIASEQPQPPEGSTNQAALPRQPERTAARTDKTPAAQSPATSTLGTPAERYAAARALEGRGDRTGALKAYAALLGEGGSAIDPAIRFASLLRGASFDATARRLVADLAKANPTPRPVAVLAALAEGADERRARLEALAAPEPDYSPAVYLLAGEYLASRGGQPTLTERRLAFDLFERFLDADSEGRLADSFIDPTLKAGWLDEARRQRGLIQSFFAGASTRPTASFSRVEAGWIANLALPEPALVIKTRIGEQGDLRPTGLTGETDPRTGRAAPVAQVALPASQGRTTLYVAYLDRAGKQAGPFPIGFDPATALVEAGRETLERYPETWVSFRPDIPNLLSFAQLVSNRCAIRTALIGFGDDPPRRPLALPPCDPAGPMAVADARPVLSLPDGVDAVTVKIAYADGTESPVRTFRR
ncbi:MAG: hypothetical protein JO048_12640 [Methylobacteriaceae bacterium]|nr:hypothetical protein [Methylobacteriaceae bacterium]